MHWTAVVITCRNKESAKTLQSELERRQQNGFFHQQTLCLAIEDPKQAVGSGGATLNALLLIAERLSARKGYTVVTFDALEDARILILHMGRNFPLDCCGRAFVALPFHRQGRAHTGVVYNLDLLLDLMTKMNAMSPSGLWVCSTDMLLSIPDILDLRIDDDDEAVCIATESSVTYAKDHGVYRIDNEGMVCDIVYRGSEEKIMKCSIADNCVPLVCGVVYFAAAVVEKLLSFHAISPLDACTYVGLDAGAKPIELSLFFDMLVPMMTDVTQAEFISGSRSLRHFSAGHAEYGYLLQARTILWRELRDVKIKSVVMKGSSHYYLDWSPSKFARIMIQTPPQHSDAWVLDRYAHSSIKCDLESESAVVINSVVGTDCVIGDDTIVMHCSLPDNTVVGRNVYLSGLTLQKAIRIPDNLAIQQFDINCSGQHETVLTVFGTADNLELPYTHSESTFCGRSWDKFFQQSGVLKTDLWSQVKAEERNLVNAQLFSHQLDIEDVLWFSDADESSERHKNWRSTARVSLRDIMSVGVHGDLDKRRELQFTIVCDVIRDTLLNGKNFGLSDVYRSWVDFSDRLLQTLDSIGQESRSPGVVARTLANIADVMGCMATSQGGLRSGPASNPEWRTAFDLLEKGDYENGVVAMATERARWLSRPDLLVRAARHYEGAAQILIRQAVMTAKQFISTEVVSPLPLGTCVEATCPARIDISGGWSDTPPITYEHGGAVTNAAISLDGERPIGAKVTNIKKPELVLHVGADVPLIVTEHCQMSDYNQPNAPGALLKAAVLCAGLVSGDVTEPLSQQLQQRWGGGFDISVWSHLPQGSGLGTSSILAGALLAALWTAAGRKYNTDSLIHAVLHLEQVLTSGGGWQDQVGGIIPGIKIGHSEAELPLRVKYTPLEVSESSIEALNSRLVLVYTGRTRLARNLLQNVIRNWYAREPEILFTQDGLVQNAWACSDALASGDLEEVGRCMDIYWEQKKKMAPGCEPDNVTLMMTSLRPQVYGMCMAGAGGGGFLYVLTRDPDGYTTVTRTLEKLQMKEKITVHRAAVDNSGLVVRVI